MLSHPYTVFRVRLAHRALLQFAASLQSSLEILLFIAGPGLLGLLAAIALPSLYAATLAWPAAIGLILAQALATAAPVWLLRKRLLPADVARWLLPLPLAPALRWRADAAVAAILVGPLALAYLVSIGVWLQQWPAWLRPVLSAGLAATAASLLLTWAGATLILAARGRAPAPTRRRRQPAATSGYSAGAARPRLPLLWHRLFWLPFWRGENPVGMRQSLLCLAAAGAAALWLWHPAPIPAAVLGIATSAGLTLLTDRGDKAVREQIAMLRPVLAAWPLETRRLERLACALSLLPAMALLLLFGAALATSPAGHSHKVAALYLGAAALAQCAIVALPGLPARARVALVTISILLLTAIGSELWN
ncbi:MAG TPA: hypothetical protein DCW29_17575 [Janthinobacterium sp.]|nr:hypothetical protein [Janthinobacterium sp.]